MKKIALFLVLMTTLLSCSLDDPDRYNFYVLPVESYTMPSTFKVGVSHKIELKYQRPTVCYNYGGVYYVYGTGADSFTRTIGINANTKVGDVCAEELPPLSDAYFNFVPQEAGTYTFKFYKGSDEDDADGDGNKEEDLFEEVEIVVTNS